MQNSEPSQTSIPLAPSNESPLVCSDEAPFLPIAGLTCEELCSVLERKGIPGVFESQFKGKKR